MTDEGRDLSVEPGPDTETPAEVSPDLEAPADAGPDLDAPADPSPPEKVGFWRRWGRRIGRFISKPRTPMGALGLIGGVFVLAALGTLGGVHLVEYSESSSFCTLCHTMIPQKKAYFAGSHQDVACGECHVAPGVLGFVKAKLAGTRELYALVTSTYPTPIPPIEHDALPPTEQTCQKCHALSQFTNSQPSKLIARPVFAQDEKNTRNDLAVLVRPANAGTPDAKSVHWHVLQDVTYTSPDEHLQTIDSVEFRDPKTGELEQFIAERQVRQSSNAGADLARLKATQANRTMECIDCHNRVGHGVPSADEAIDKAMASGAISPDLPYIKRNAISLITTKYATDEEGKAAIGRLADFYKQKYPLVASQKASEISKASASITGIFDLTVTSAMNTRDGTYPNNLGHQTSPGCFRCHDGAHYKVVKGQITNETIPSTCETCHTFPQQGKTSAASVPLGTRPATHTDPLWVFNHRNVAGGVTPNPKTCGACHQASYCQNCHDSGAISVDHYKMLYNHAQSVRDARGTNACAVCHQPAFCSQCHKDSVLGKSNSQLGKG